MSELSPGLPDGINPTLDAVAARAGVSPITVSRVVRTPDKVRAAIRARVEGGFAVVGLGNLEMGRLTKPTLSTLGIDGTAIGRAAAALTIGDASERCIDLGFALLRRDSG